MHTELMYKLLTKLLKIKKQITKAQKSHKSN